MYFQIWQSTKNNHWYFHIKSGNHEVVVESQGYTTKESAVQTAKAIKAAVGSAGIYNLDGTEIK